MQPSVACYPIPPTKQKAVMVCRAFADGVIANGGIATVCDTVPRRLLPGDAMFYGVRTGIEHLWRQVKDEQRTFWYADNGYFDCVRGTHFRITKNALQATGQERPDFERFQQLGLTIKPWREDGEHIALIMQSDEFMRVVCGYKRGANEWREQVLSRIRVHTNRPIHTRAWDPDKRSQSATLPNVLRNAWALVTHTSAAANEAVMLGIPVFTTGPCAAAAMGSSDLTRVAAPVMNWSRLAWAAALAGLQWTIEEIASGVAWAELNREEAHA